MPIKYQWGLANVSWERISQLFMAVGFGERKPADLEGAFMRSSHVRLALDGDKIVGFGRTVDDGMFYAMICDLIVHPDYQGRGIGKAILAALRDKLSSFCFTTLTAAPGKEGFYLSQGWKEQNSAFIWPRSEKQRLLYTRMENEAR